MATAHSVKQDRHTFLGGSDAAGIIGASPWRSTYRVWCEKTGIESPPDLDDLEFVYFGNVLEPIVAAEFQRRVGIRVQQKRQLLRDKQYPFIGGHIDRKVLKERAFLECKTSNAFDYKLWGPSESGRDGVPSHYQAQCDHYMRVEDCTHCYVATLIGGNQFRWYRMERAPEIEKRLIDAEVAFWSLVQSKTPPPVISEVDAKHRWQQIMLGASVAVGKPERTEIVKLANLIDRRKQIDKEEKALRNWLFPLFQDKESISEGGEILARLSSYSQNRVDLDLLHDNWPKIEAKVRRPVPVKRLSITI